MGKEDEAVGSLIAILSLAKSLADEPCLISQEVKCGCIRDLSGSYEQVANRCKLSPASLKRLKSAFAEREKRASAGAGFKVGLPGQSAIFSSFTEAPLKQQLEALRILPLEQTVEMTNALTKKYSRVEDQHFLTKFHDDILTAVTSAKASWWKDAYEICGTHEAQLTPGLVASSIFVSEVAGALQVEYDSLRTLRILQTSIALQQYRQENRCYPQSLLTLVPDYLQVTPMEPSDSRLLKYRVTGHGYEIVSAVPKKGLPGKPKDISLKVVQRFLSE